VMGFTQVDDEETADDVEVQVVEDE
jgi:hypothetical protein